MSEVIKRLLRETGAVEEEDINDATVFVEGFCEAAKTMASLEMMRNNPVSKMLRKKHD